MIKSSVLFLLASTVLTDAFQAFSDTSFTSSNLTKACIDALSRDLDCDPSVTSFRSGEYYPEAILNQTCTVRCDNSLSEYAANVLDACHRQSWSGYEDEEMPLAIIPDMLHFQYNLTCLMDSGRYCNVVAASAAGLNPAQRPLNDEPEPAYANVSSSNSSAFCDMCALQNLRIQAESPYFDGPMLAERSVYQSRTSSCAVSTLPLATRTLPFAT